MTYGISVHAMPDTAFRYATKRRIRLSVNMPKLRRSCFQQVNIERDFNLRELKKAAEEKQKVREKNAKKEKNKSE